MVQNVRSKASYGSKGTKLSTVWSRKTRSLALYGLEKLGCGFSSMYVYTDIIVSHPSLSSPYNAKLSGEASGHAGHAEHD